MNITAVCKGCQERYPACWGSCPKYLEARAELDKKKEVRKAHIQMDHAIKETQYNGLHKWRKEKT